MPKTLLLLLVLLVASTRAFSLTYSRREVIDAALREIDYNHDGCLNKDDMARAIKAAHLSDTERRLIPRSERVMELCDKDRDGCINRVDFEATSETCLPTFTHRSAFMRRIINRIEERRYDQDG